MSASTNGSGGVVTVLEPKKSVTDITREKIAAVAATATEEEKQRVADILARARTGGKESAVYTLTPAMSALLFLGHNAHNRDWRAEGAKSCLEYARRMTSGQWKWNNASIGFYVDAELEDGQHRLSAAAIAGYTLEITVVFGIDRDAKVTVDDGAARHAADAVKLDGIANPKAKQVLVKFAANYLVKAGKSAAGLHSESDVADVIKAHSFMLDEALAIGEASVKNIMQPVLKPTAAAQLAYLMLSAAPAWNEQRVREALALFQTGQSTEGEKTPFFIAAEVIVTARGKRKRDEKLSAAKEIGVAVAAMIATERGIRAVSTTALKAAVKGTLPNPAYPDVPQMAEAAE